MRHAGVRSVRIAFEAIGAADAPVVLVAGGISAHRHVAASARFPEAGWANDLVGAGRALDPPRHRLLAFDYIGRDGTPAALIDTGHQDNAAAGPPDARSVKRGGGKKWVRWGRTRGASRSNHQKKQKLDT